MARDWTLEADEIVALPLDELALLVLRDAHANGEWNWGNWLISAQRSYAQRTDAMQALGEAWGWLQNHGLIAWNPTQSSDKAFVISRKGHQLLSDGLPWLRAVERLDVELMPVLERTARPQFLRGDFETAAFAAMKEVEVQVRTRAGLGSGPDEVGVKLMVKAFKQGGPLFRAELEGGESQAQMNLFAGAIGLFKNPSSHRRVDFKDPTEAAEIVLLADLLLRLLDKIEDPQPSTPEADGQGK
ncbi:TIGR02391 family protein [Streptomyces griseoloalbus]|uniref:TIGR02391 family protein n=1 Tax=Streptomyces griseoloalbus TaxID=67303 RepID=UPI0033A3DD74